MATTSMSANFVVCKSFARHYALRDMVVCRCMKSTKAAKSSASTPDITSSPPVSKKGASAAKAMKKFNFENLSLFGPVLRSSKGTKVDKGLRLSYLDERAPRRVRAPRLACEDPETVRIARASERVYRTQLEAELLDALAAISDEEATRLNAEDRSGKVDIQIPTKSFDLEATLNFPLLNFLRDGVPDEDTGELALDSPGQNPEAAKGYPSVTAILKTTIDEQSKLRLEKWKEKMIAEMGADGFKMYQELILSQGKSLHANIHDLLNGTPRREIIVQPQNEGHWCSLEPFWPELGKVLHLESPVCHPHLQYRGIVDCVAVYRNELMLIDWKTSKKPKPRLSDTFDNPLQVAAYVGALNYDENYQTQVRDALIVVAYEDGSPCQVHHLGPALCQRHWQRWLLRLRTYWSLLQHHREDTQSLGP